MWQNDTSHHENDSGKLPQVQERVLCLILFSPSNNQSISSVKLSLSAAECSPFIEKAKYESRINLPALHQKTNKHVY